MREVVVTTTTTTTTTTTRKRFEKIKKLSNTTNDEEEEKDKVVLVRVGDETDATEERFRDVPSRGRSDGVRRESGLERKHVCDFKSDENVHAEIRKVRGRRETKSGGGKFREEFIEQTVRGRVQKELILKIFYRCFLFIARKSRPLYIIKSIDILL